jgi:hypothetical protein
MGLAVGTKNHIDILNQPLVICAAKEKKEPKLPTFCKAANVRSFIMR